MSRALLIIDIQRDYFPGGANPLVEPERAAGAARRLLDALRESGEPIVHLQHVWDAPEATFMRPGTDGALALAMMNVLITEGMADRAYLARYTDFDDATEHHILSRTPAWAAAITGLAEREIIDFARLYGRTARSFIRAGFGFTRTRNGSAAMHAVSCLPAISGAWQHRGGGAFFLAYDKDAWGIDTTIMHGLDVIDPSTINSFPWVRTFTP